MKKSCKIPLILQFVVIFFPTFGQSIVLKDDILAKNITSEVEILPNTNESFEVIRTKSFKKSDRTTLIDIASANPLWIKVSIGNQSKNQSKWIVECHDRGMENLDFYVPDPTGSFRVEKRGMLTPKNTFWFVDEPAYVSIDLQPNTTKTLFIKLYGDRSFFHEVWISTPEEFVRRNQQTIFGNSFLWGVLFIRLILVVLLVFSAVREPIFRVYGFHTFVTVLTILGLYHTLGRLFTQNLQAAVCINYLGVHFVTLSQVIFTFFAIPVYRFPKVVKYILYLSMTINLAIATFIVLDNQWYWVNASIYLSVYSALFIVLLFLYSFIKKYEVRWYYGVAFLLGLGGFLATRMMTIGWFGGEVNILIVVAALLFIGDNFFFAFFLGKIIKNYERSKINSEIELEFNKLQSHQLRELDQMKTNFFANISHEFRTPLTLILAPIEDLIQKNPTHDVYKIIQRNANRLLQLINQILDLTKLESHQMQINASKVELVRYFRTLTSAYSSLAESRQIQFRCEQNQNELWGMIDTDKLEKILHNLLSNAFKFTEKGGQVDVKIDLPPHCSPQARNFNSIFVTVKDTGIGIASDKLPKIFNRFYQVDDAPNRRFEGTGIGLALVKELVDVLNGKIWVESEVGQGTTFFVELPFQITSEAFPSTDAPGPVTGRIDLHKETPQNAKRQAVVPERLLLIVDDNTDIRTYIRGVFAQEYRIIEAVNGVEGLQQAFEQIPDLIISDLMMPQMDGFEFCKSLKSDERTCHIPLIMLTAKANIESRIEGLEHGADDYLIKPFYTDEIKARVHNLIQKQQRLQAIFGKRVIELKPESAKPLSAEEMFLLKVKQIVEQRLSDGQFGVEQFCAEIGMSQSQLLRKMKAVSNKTVVEFVRDYRLQRAAELIRQNTGNIAEIALQVGFENQSYFARTFQEKFGKLPSEY